MELTFGEIADLEHHLLETGRRVSTTEVDSIVQGAAAWFASLPSTTQERLGADTFATVITTSRGHVDLLVQHLCLGALIHVHNYASKDPDKARFVAQFAAQRARSSSSPIPFCSPIEEAEAQALFEAAKGDRSFSDEELIALASKFIDEHRSSPGFFGRLAGSLAFLVTALRESNKDQHIVTARAALTYFVVSSDAIPDDLGFVGLLDDALIVHKAVAEIFPERRDVVKLLEDITTYWPFVEAIALASAAGRYPMSEFVLVNTGLLLQEIRAEGVNGVVVVVPTAGPLPLLCGFLRAIAEIRNSLSDTKLPTYSAGERLLNRANGDIVEFLSYCRLNAKGSSQSCDLSDATHFQFRTKQGNRALALKDIAVFERAVRTTGTLRHGKIAFDARSMTMGPMERLFGQTQPVHLPSMRRRVIVVMDLQDARRLSSELTLFGTPLSDVVPTSGARVLRDGCSDDLWTTNGPGGKPMLTVVRTVADALELLENEDIPVTGVIARVRPGTTDAKNISDLHNSGVPVVAFVTPSDSETHAALAASRLRFWKWDDRWFGALHWPPSMDDHDVGRYEGWLRDALASKIDIVTLEAPALDRAWLGLTALSKQVEEDGDAMLSIFLREAISLFNLVRSRLVPIDPRTASKLSEHQKRLTTAARSGIPWWTEENATIARKMVADLNAAVEHVIEKNPKWEALRQWAERNPTGTIICNRSNKAVLETKRPEQCSIATPDDCSHHTATVIPVWSRAEKMDRLLYPPVSSGLTLLLYGPELSWYEASVRRHERTARRLDHLVSEHSPFRIPRVQPARRPEDAPNTSILSSPEPVDPDEMAGQVLRAQLLRQWGSDVTDPVIARLVRFAGGSWALFSAERRVHTITHFLETESRNRHEMHEIPAWELRSGDVVVLVRGSDTDVIRDAVDAKVPPGARATAALWQRALRRHGRLHSTEEIARALSKAGCHRRASTVARWLRDDSMIRPRYGREDIEAIAKVTGDSELQANIDVCVEASDEVFRQHAIVGRELAEKIMGTALEWMAAGVAPEDVIEIDDRIAVVTVETVDPMTITIPRRYLGRLEDGR